MCLSTPKPQPQQPAPPPPVAPDLSVQGAALKLKGRKSRIDAAVDAATK